MLQEGKTTILLLQSRTKHFDVEPDLHDIHRQKCYTMERRSKGYKIDCISVSISSIFYKIEHKFDGVSYAAKEPRKEFFL
jgi:hypothetical protein